MQRLQLTGHVSSNARDALDRVERGFRQAGLYVTDAQQHGGLALVIRWSMKAGDGARLAASLADHGVALSDESNQALIAGVAEPDVSCWLRLTLVHDGPDEKTDVPSVPG